MELYTIKTNEVYGRYMVTSRDLKAGELILQESPTVVGSPIIDATHICFKCSQKLHTKVQICKRCGVATLCSNDCVGIKHTDAECEVLEKTGLKAKDFVNDPQIIMPLRCLLVKSYDEKLWNELMKLESHVKQRKCSSIWKAHEVAVQDVMKRLNIITEQDIEQMLVQKICGILDVNTFELRPPNSKHMMVNSKDCLRGLYLKASLMTHDCIGNTHLSISDDLTMTVHASVPIPEGETIFFNYSSCLKGTFERRLHLRSGKYFDCNCKRCSDPTELGTHMSSMKCTKCKCGYVVPSDPLSNIFATFWNCELCGSQYKGQLVRSTLNVAQEKIFDLDLSNLGKAERLLKMLLMSLAEDHHLILELKQNMVSVYETIFADWALKRKITICEEILKVLRTVEPGISRLQGIALYQLHATKVNLANMQYQEKHISTDNYLDRLQDAETNMVESMKHLMYEPKNSPEGRLLQNAFMDLKILRSMIKQLQGSCRVSKLPEKDDLFLNVKTKRKL